VFSSDWRTVAAFTRPDTVQLWEGRRWVRRDSLRVHTDRAADLVLALSPDGSKLAIRADENSVQLWDVRGRTLLATLVDRTRSMPKSNSEFSNDWISFSPDGRTLAATIYGAVQLWDVRRRVLLATLPGVTGAVTFSPDGHTLAASSDNTVRLWNLEKHALMATLTGHTDDVFDISYSPDGRTLATASADDTVRLWDVDQHALVATLTGHDKDVGGVAFSPDGHTLVTASLDGTVRLWAADISHAARRICDVVGHDLSRQQWMRFLPESPYQHTCT
jgi:WD40 repeat protein